MWLCLKCSIVLIVLRGYFRACAIGVIMSVWLLVDLLLYNVHGLLWVCVGLSLFIGQSLMKCPSPPHL